MTLQIEIPESVFRLPSSEISREVLETVAIEGFKSRQLTTFQVRKLLGFETRFEVHEFLADHDVPWADIPIEDLNAENETLKKLLRK